MADTSSSATESAADTGISGRVIAFVGKLVGMPRREAQDLVRARGGIPVEKPGVDTRLIVVGDHGLPLDARGGADLFEPDVQQAIERGAIELIGETQLWERLGLVDEHRDIHRLYTPAMLAELLGVPVAIVRRWHRRGLIVPTRQVRKLPYFDFGEIATARRLAELLAAGVSPQAIERKLAALARYLPSVERPLAQLSVIVEGSELLLRQGDGLIEPGGQLRFDFDAGRWASPEADGAAVQRATDTSGESDFSTGDERPETSDRPLTPYDLVQLADRLEEEGELQRAAELYRASLAAGGPHADTCFRLAEVLYRIGDLHAARERYYMVIEIDDDFVEARANLGCVLMELGQYELAEAAFQGALAYHSDYPDAHYHLARLLDDLGRPHEALPHWRSFAQLSPTSPWADEASGRLSDTD